MWNENVATNIDANGNILSPVLPDLRLANDGLLVNPNPVLTNDWRYSWMFTGQQNNTSSGSTFDGNIVIFENRPFCIEAPSPPNPVAALPVIPG